MKMKGDKDMQNTITITVTSNVVNICIQDKDTHCCLLSVPYDFIKKMALSTISNASITAYNKLHN